MIISYVDERDGTTYQLIKIGGLFWSLTNLQYKSEGSICYNNDETVSDLYGRLYDYDSAIKAIPDGFRLPTVDDYRDLYFMDNRGSALGFLLKSEIWPDYPKPINLYGFSALPFGRAIKGENLVFEGLGTKAYFMLDEAMSFSLHSFSMLSILNKNKSIDYYSVRFVKNA